MRSFILTLAIVLLLPALEAKEPDNKPPTGIRFFSGTWDAALKTAEQEKKLIFLDIYATWCGPCRLMKKDVFSDKAVGEYFNAHFINVSIDGERGEGIKLANNYKVRGYPALYFVNHKGKVVSARLGFMNASQLIKFGKQVKK